MSDILFDEYPMVMKRGQQEKIQLKYKQKKPDKSDLRDLSFLSNLRDKELNEQYQFQQ